MFDVQSNTIDGHSNGMQTNHAGLLVCYGTHGRWAPGARVTHYNYVYATHLHPVDLHVSAASRLAVCAHGGQPARALHLLSNTIPTKNGGHLQPQPHSIHPRRPACTRYAPLIILQEVLKGMESVSS